MSKTINMVKVFKSEEFGEVRVLIVDGEPWFIGKEVAAILGYSNVNKAVFVHVDSEDKYHIMLDIADTLNGDVPSNQPETILVNEFGLYSLILSSTLPVAKRFKRWVTSGVLPSIRKHGMYTAEELLSDPDLAIKAFTALKEEREKRLGLEEAIEADKPLVEFANRVFNNSDLIDVDTFAEIVEECDRIDVGGTGLISWLCENGYLMNSSEGEVQPLQKYIEQGLFEVREYKYTTPYGNKVEAKTMVTGKGQVFFVEKLRTLFGTKAEAVSDSN